MIADVIIIRNDPDAPLETIIAPQTQYIGRDVDHIKMQAILANTGHLSDTPTSEIEILIRPF